MKQLVLILTVLTSLSAFAGPLLDAHENLNLPTIPPNPTAYSQAKLEKLTAKILICTHNKIIPCDKVAGDKNHQIIIVKAYVEQLRSTSTEYTIAKNLLEKLTKPRLRWQEMPIDQSWIADE